MNLLATSKTDTKPKKNYRFYFRLLLLEKIILIIYSL